MEAFARLFGSCVLQVASVDISADSRPIVDRYIDRLTADASADMQRLTASEVSVKYRSTIDRQSVEKYLNSRPIYRPTCRPRPPTKIHEQRFIAPEITAKTKTFLYSRRKCLIGRCARKRGNNAKAKHTISSVILLTVCRTILMMLVQRICIRSINTLLIDISLFSQHLSA